MIHPFLSNAGAGKLLFAMNGAISNNLQNAILEVAENGLNNLACGTRLRKRAFHILVECLQNIMLHGDDFSHDPHSQGQVMISALPDGVLIRTGNEVSQAQAVSIRKKLEKLDGCQEQALRETYKKQLVNGDLSDQGGAGLGFVDIARKSGNDIDYRFYPMDNNRLFFSLIVKVENNRNHSV